MITWLALIIPIATAIVLFTLYKKVCTWWELTLPTILTVIIILLFRLFYEMGATIDTEYRGYLATDAKYYEYYETWVEKQCSKEVCSGSGKDEVCHTVYYDCSECEKFPAKYIVYDNNGHEFSVSMEYWVKLIRQWNANPEFENLNRDIKKHNQLFGRDCGQDGNLFKIKWDNKPETSEATVTTSTFTNKILASKSSFSYETISEEEKVKLGLYDYPKMYSFYKQEVVLGLDKIPVNGKKIIRKKFEYLNGLGSKHHGKLIVLLYPNKAMDISFKQEAYWVGGKDNQLTVCIGYDPKTYKMDWVRAFSWDKDKKSIVESREDLMQVGSVLKMNEIYDKLYVIMNEYHSPRDFKDFDYLEVEFPTWSTVVIYILSLIGSIGLARWIIINEFENNDVC